MVVTDKLRRRVVTCVILAVLAAGAALASPAAKADNKRLNDGVVANVYTIQHRAGCATDLKINPQLPQAAR
jgi:hypothetical protein